MKALCITAPRTTEYREVAKPVPGPDEVLLRVRYVGYCGSDLSTFRGANPLAAYPRIPGHELSGTVAALGANVTSATVGQISLVVPYTSCGTCTSCRAGRRNCCRNNQTLGVQRDGALSEWLAVPAAKLLCAPTLDLRALSLVEPLTIGFHAAARGRVGRHETVAVWGCGMIGLGAIAGAAVRGARVIALDLDEQKLDLARAAGASETIMARGDVHAELQRLTGGDGPNVAIEAIGIAQTFRACVEEVAFAGRVVYIGYAKEPVAYETKLFVQKELDVLGSRNADPEDFRAVIAHLEAQRFPVQRAITRTAPFAEAAAALTEWDRDPNVVTKILIDVQA